MPPHMPLRCRLPVTSFWLQAVSLSRTSATAWKRNRYSFRQAAMRLDHLPGSVHLTYCTNIHAGESWDEVRDSLEAHLPRIKAAVSPGAPLGVGLRLSAIAAQALGEPAALDELRLLLSHHDLYVFTINAFPYGPFHGTRVKEDVYQPDWLTAERLTYTDQSAGILARL